jgi:3',5'-cyclic AMP phosphodiesterase CpdA
MTPLRLLHISDLHFTPFPIPATDVDDKLAVADLDALIRVQDRADQLLRDLRRTFRERAQWPHGIIVSGDLVDKGGTARADDGRSEFDVAVRFLERLADLFSLSNDRVFVVPGNHDIDWTPGLNRLQRYRSYLDAVAGFRSPYEQAGRLVPRFEQLRSEDGTVILDLALLASPTFSGEPDPGAGALRDSLREMLATAGDEASGLDLERAFSPRPLDIAALGAQQLREISEHEHHRDSVRIAVLHHHLLPIDTVEITPFESVVDGGRVLDTLIRSGYDLILTGHKHERRLSRLHQDAGAVDVLTGPSLFLTNPGGTRAGFTMIDVQPARSPSYAVLHYFDSADARATSKTELIWPSRVDPEVTKLAASMSDEHQQEHLLPVLSAVREAMTWRDGFEYVELDELFERAWEQLRTELSELADRQLTIRPPLLLKPWESFIRLARRLTPDESTPSIRLASENDLAYWKTAIDSRQSEAARYSKPLREFNGPKTRTLVLKDDVFKPGPDSDAAGRVIHGMVSDGFHVEVVPDSRLERRTERDFGLVGQLAVFTFSGRRDEVRGLEIDFKPETVRRYEESWRVLNEAALWDSGHPQSFRDWVEAAKPFN